MAPNGGKSLEEHRNILSGIVEASNSQHDLSRRTFAGRSEHGGVDSRWVESHPRRTKSAGHDVAHPCILHQHDVGVLQPALIHV
jgi:hypothetical protein